MELVFRKLYPRQSVAAPQPGEIYLLATGDRQDLANLVFESGIDALVHGPSPFTRIVIDADAKFDDMLAAMFVERLAAGKLLPKGCGDFARYTGLFRDGLRPGSFPLENSLEGVFLAIRCHPKKPLTDPETGREFLTAWSRLGDMIFEAAECNADPFTTPLLNLLREEKSIFAMDAFNPMMTNPKALNTAMDFTPEREFLKEDLAIYRNDVAHGEKWDIRLPGGPAKARGLLLHQPQSLLFKYWTRSQCPPPVGGPFAFVATTFWQGQWVFSTDPRHKMSLQGLAERLQAVEQAKDPERAKENPWFDGKPTGYQVVAAPRAGTALADDDVIKLTKKWCKARSITPEVSVFRAGLKWVGVLLVVVSALALTWANVAPSRAPLQVNDLHVLAIGVTLYDKQARLSDLPCAVKDAEALAAAFRESRLCKPEDVHAKVITDFQATRVGILNAFGNWLLNQPLTKYSLVVVTLSGHGMITKQKGYVFAPHDFDAEAKDVSGISFSDLHSYLERLPCPAVVVFDTCHSGGGDANDDPYALTMKGTVESARSKRGIAVMVACDSEQKANEDARKWNHGALTLALLESVRGKCLVDEKKLPLPQPSAEGFVYLSTIDTYVKDRVEALSSLVTNVNNRGQRPQTFCTRTIVPEQIPLARYAAQ